MLSNTGAEQAPPRPSRGTGSARSVRSILSGAVTPITVAWPLPTGSPAGRALGSEEELAARFRVDHGHLRLQCTSSGPNGLPAVTATPATPEKLAPTPLTVAWRRRPVAHREAGPRQRRRAVDKGLLREPLSTCRPAACEHACLESFQPLPRWI